MTFKFMSWVMAFAGSALGARFIFAGATIMRDWGLEATEGPLILGRRIAALYFGLAIMFFLGRDVPPSTLRSAVSVGIGVALALLAALGVYERWAGRVSSGIIVPALIEAVFAAGFAWAWWTDR
jgi:hypothetical protein